MKCMYAQTRPRFILSSEGVFGGMEFEPMSTPREKSPLPKMSPEEDRTRDAVDSEPKHYQLSYSVPPPPPHPTYIFKTPSKQIRKAKQNKAKIANVALGLKLLFISSFIQLRWVTNPLQLPPTWNSINLHPRSLKLICALSGKVVI